MESKGENNRRNIDVEVCKELLGAAQRGDTERVRKLLQSEGVDARYSLEKDGFGLDKTCLRLACATGRVETVRVLLEHGGETQEELEGAWCDAAMNGRVAVVKLLLERRMDPSARNNWAVHWAAEHGHCNVVELLLRD